MTSWRYHLTHGSLSVFEKPIFLLVAVPSPAPVVRRSRLAPVHGFWQLCSLVPLGRTGTWGCSIGWLVAVLLCRGCSPPPGSPIWSVWRVFPLPDGSSLPFPLSCPQPSCRLSTSSRLYFWMEIALDLCFASHPALMRHPVAKPWHSPLSRHGSQRPLLSRRCSWRSMSSRHCLWLWVLLYACSQLLPTAACHLVFVLCSAVFVQLASASSATSLVVFGFVLLSWLLVVVALPLLWLLLGHIGCLCCLCWYRCCSLLLSDSVPSPPSATLYSVPPGFS